MEKLAGLPILIFFLIATGCANDEPPDDPRISPCCEKCGIVEEYKNVEARVVQWPFTCNFVLTTDSVELGISPNILIPCNDLPEQFRINDSIFNKPYPFTFVTISGHKFDSCYDFTPGAYAGFKGFGCKFEVTSIEFSARQSQIEPPIPCDDGCQVLEKLSQVKAKVFQWGPTCDFFLTTDSISMVEPGYLIGSDNILIPCVDIPEEFRVEESFVTVSGFKYDCCENLTHWIVKTSKPFGCKFQITSIEAIN